MTALTALDREGLCPQQQQQHEKRKEINSFQFKPASEKKGSVTRVPKENIASKERDERGREQKEGVTGRGKERLSSLFHLRVAC